MCCLPTKTAEMGASPGQLAVLTYHFGHLTEILIQNLHIHNRLACLVSESMELPYLKVVFVVFVCTWCSHEFAEP